MGFEIKIKEPVVSFHGSGTISDLLRAVTILCESIDELAELDERDHLVFRLFVREVLPDIVFDNDDKFSDILAAFKRGTQ